MWHWQLNALFKDLFTLSKRQQFFVQLCLFALCAHVIFFIMMTLLSYGLQSHDRFVVSSQPKTSLYVLSPLQKHIEQNKKEKKRHKKSVTSSKVIDEQTYKKELKKQKNTDKKYQQSEQQATLEITEVKDLADKLPVEKKVTVQKASVKLSEQKIVPSVLKKIEEDKVQQELEQTDLDLDNVTFVGYQDLDHVMVQEIIAQAVQQYFKPPVGMDSDISVELCVQVGDQGKVVKIDVMRSSGIVVYDSSARVAVYKAILPKEVWNKTVTIVLGQ